MQYIEKIGAFMIKLDMSPPLKLYIQQEACIVKDNFTVYLSYRIKEPNPDNHSVKFVCPKVITLEEFPAEVVYMSVYVKEHTNIRMLVNFSKDKALPKHEDHDGECDDINLEQVVEDWRDFSFRGGCQKLVNKFVDDQRMFSKY